MGTQSKNFTAIIISAAVNEMFALKWQVFIELTGIPGSNEVPPAAQTVQSAGQHYHPGGIISHLHSKSSGTLTSGVETCQL